MIKVVIKFTKKTYKSGREKFIYNDISIKGHSSDGTLNSLKCCAGVTAITSGIIHLVDLSLCCIELNKGYFHISVHHFDDELNYALHTLVYQLVNVATIYPEFFNDIDFIEGEN